MHLLSRSRLVFLHSESDLDLQNDTVSIKKSGKSIPKSPKFPAGVEFLPPLFQKVEKQGGGAKTQGFELMTRTFEIADELGMMSEKYSDLPFGDYIHSSVFF